MTVSVLVIESCSSELMLENKPKSNIYTIQIHFKLFITLLNYLQEYIHKAWREHSYIYNHYMGYS